MESWAYKHHSQASEGTRSVLSYPQDADRRQVAAPWPVAADPPLWGAGGGAVVAAPKHLPDERTRIPADSHFP